MCVYVHVNEYVVHVFIMHYVYARARVHIELSKDHQHRLQVNSTCSSPKQEPMCQCLRCMPEVNSRVNSQRVIAGRDLENSLLKGTRSRLKQYTSIYMIIVLVSFVQCCPKPCISSTVCIEPCACMCSTDCY